jgi:hypothetical protein
MESLGFSHVIDIIAKFGVPGLVLIVWYLSDRSQLKLMQQYRDDTRDIMNQHEASIMEMRKMYENNVELVRVTQRLLLEHKDVVIMVTQTMTRMCDKIDGNQYCPMIRIKKEAVGRQAE